MAIRRGAWRGPALAEHLSSPRAPWARLLLPFAAGYYLSYLLRTVNAVISPDLTRELGLSAADLGLLTGAYFFGFAAAQIPVGIALDRYGPRRVESALLVLAPPARCCLPSAIH